MSEVQLAVVGSDENGKVSLCSFANCGRKKLAKDLCSSHYYQKHVAKTDLKPILRSKGSLPIIEFDEMRCPRNDLKGSCRIFRGCKRANVYGTVSFHGKKMLVHRYVWERDVGPIPQGMVMDHRCMVPACINIDHLRVVTRAVNNAENTTGSSSKTHCPQGHPYDDVNTARSKHGRICRECHRVRSRKRHHQLKTEAAKHDEPKPTNGLAKRV